MIESITDFEIRCHKCDKKVIVYENSMDIEMSIYDHGDNCMGIENIYNIDQEIICPNCRNKIKIDIMVTEYPIGAVDSINEKMTGADFITRPQYITELYQEFDIDEDSVNESGIHNVLLEISRDKERIYSISSREFEEVVEQLFKDEGFETHLTGITRDGGKDIIATKPGINNKMDPVNRTQEKTT